MGGGRGRQGSDVLFYVVIRIWSKTPANGINIFEPRKREGKTKGTVCVRISKRLHRNTAIKVHTGLDPGLLESAYQKCIAYELTNDGLKVESEVLLPITYEKIRIEAGYRIDMIVEGSAIFENKTVEKLLPIHKAQLLTYRKMENCKLGFLLNWNVPHMKNGIKRMVNNL